jgi:N-acetylglucosamine-6-phosphate deacetylase
VSIGHSDATAAQTREAILAGARHLTHCWNAHRRLTSRDPGPAGVALGGDGLVVGLVGDLVHVAPEIVAMTMRSAAGRVAVTTDAIAGAGATEGEWEEHGRRVRVVDGVARLDDGTIAGGIAGPDDCLRNLIRLGVAVADAVQSCGGVQRRLLGLAEVLARPGDPADLAVFDDDWRPLRTLVGGHEVWVE